MSKLNLQRVFIKLTVLFCLGISANAFAIWFESSGQAIIENGNREFAREKATQEAIKQALLYSGASVRSVQRMANGLLKDDHLEIRSHGEVNAIELIHESYEDGYVTVSIRADIFPQGANCPASDYKKTISTARFPIIHREHAAVGNIYGIGAHIPLRLQSTFDNQGQYAEMSSLEPYYLNPDIINLQQHVVQIARKHNTQYVLLAAITELSLEHSEESISDKLSFWEDNYPLRHFKLNVSLYEGQTGGRILQKSYATQAQWEFDQHIEVDVNTQELWSSRFGREVDGILQEIVEDVDESISCTPAYGRVLAVKNEEIHINLGSNAGVKQGDEFTLLQVSQFYDPIGTLHYQYQVHPTRVRVSRTYSTSAVVKSIDGSLLANIQPNDFVARQ
ncbi:flagellar assembly protein FlgT [Aestuariibacter sp. AA17]|uniref:Flagellar assembly protein FlgT n=1 Tax=Fluctibacter corallii TaxID=2984329 RepID=A0ABT3A9Y3_9ALTE|nr:flagella assembly protein FlgT [Aestuariibacter sp. AA17]MCV2885495.1 flagellar assembly protein FlgT [Aestuariibacter sp. AA17]